MVKTVKNKPKLITAIQLIILISVSYFFSDANYTNAVIFISIASIIKFISVSFQFMEAKKANNFWKFLMTIFAASYFIAILVFY